TGPVGNGSIKQSLQSKSRKPKFATIQDDKKLFQGLVEAFEHLLRATAETKHCQNNPSRSLLSMCIRRVPSYIEYEEQSFKEEHPDDRDVDGISGDIYEDLESLGLYSEGWRSLREVVRGHGFHLVREAIADGLIDNDHVE